MVISRGVNIGGVCGVWHPPIIENLHLLYLLPDISSSSLSVYYQLPAPCMSSSWRYFLCHAQELHFIYCHNRLRCQQFLCRFVFQIQNWRNDRKTSKFPDFYHCNLWRGLMTTTVIIVQCIYNILCLLWSDNLRILSLFNFISFFCNTK